MKNENVEHCKHIAETLEAYTDGNVYRCPECGDNFRLDDEQENDGAYICPCCGATVEEGELEQLSIWDYTEDALDIRYLLDSKKELAAVKVLVAFGGPNIWIDTETRSVELYWWTDRASYPISGDVCDALEEWAAELLQC